MKKFIVKFLIVCCLFMLTFSSKASNQVRFGVIYFYPPFVFSTKSGYIHGLDIDIATAVCQQSNLQCTFIPMPLSEMFTSLKANKVDAIMGAISITPNRKTQFDFTRPYLKSTMSYVTLTNSNIDPNNLTGKRVGTIKDSTFFNYLNQKYGAAIKLFTYVTNEQLVTALSNNELDIILLDSPAANYWVRYSTGVFKTVGIPTFLSTDEGYGIAVNKGNGVLVNLFNKSLTTIIQNGTFNKIKQSYFSS